ncbi:MAG: chorismate-binding protein [Bacteroidetes bacterium]|nr:chorismate-binding protein [Bacteroidota bacterium]
MADNAHARAAAFLSLIENESAPYFFWRSPEDDFLMAAGIRAVTEPADTRDWRSWARSSRAERQDVPVLAIVAFSPDERSTTDWKEFPIARFYQPDTVFRDGPDGIRTWGSGAQAACRYGAGIASEQQQSHERDDDGPNKVQVMDWGVDAYRQRVEQALPYLRDGILEKVVLSRRIAVRCSTPFRLIHILVAMQSQPHAFTLCYSPDGERFFLSATPERLGRITDAGFETVALAGTKLRAMMAAVENGGLMDDHKERIEHAYVVDMLRDAVSTFASGITVATPEVLELPHVTHMQTRISGIMSPHRDMRDVIATLHPTPAVAGTPRHSAHEMIASLEPFERGLYSGCVGWFMQGGEGDAAVTIRSALVHGNDASIWAGAGIVRDSIAEAEERETRAKLRTMLDVLSA